MDKMGTVKFSNETALRGDVILNACSKALTAIENELPDEARSFEIYCYIIDACKEELRGRKIVL